MSNTALEQDSTVQRSVVYRMDVAEDDEDELEPALITWHVVVQGEIR